MKTKQLLLILLAVLLLPLDETRAQNWTDISSEIINTDFVMDDDKSGWAINREGGTNDVRAGCMEFWNNQHFKASQVLYDLSKGHYRLSVQGFHRYGDNDTDYNRYMAKEQTSFAYLFVNEYKKTLADYCSFSLSSAPSSNWLSPDNGRHYYPNTMETTAEAFDQGAYWNSMEFDVASDNSNIVIGIGLDDYNERNWCIFSHFKLETTNEITNEWVDVTKYFLNNPTFDENEQGGWVHDYNATTLAVNFGCMEVWDGTFNIYQDVYGLPKGQYRLSASAFYREGLNSEAYAKYKNGESEITATIYAGENELLVKNVYDFSSMSSESECWVDESGNYYPNGMSSASTAFKAGAYKNVLLFDAEGDLRIGVKNDNYINGNWAIFDNFKLEYKGEVTVANNIVSLNIPKDTIEVGEKLLAEVIVVPKDAMIKNIVWTSSDPSVFTVNGKGEILGRRRGTATLTATMRDNSNYSKSVTITVVREGYGDYGQRIDLTYLIVNPNFLEEGNYEGWTIERDGGTTAVFAGSMEFWNANSFKATQIIENLPQGHYRLSVQGFHRYSNYETDIERYNNNLPTSLAYLFVDEQKVTLTPMCEYFHLTGDNSDWVTIDNGKHYYPNTMKAAEEAFNEDAYWNYLDFTIFESRKDVTIGIGLDEYNWSNWCIFTNFVLETSDDMDFGETFSLSVLDESGNDVSGNVTVLWFNESGNQIGSGTSIGGIKKDSALYYSVLLDESLGRVYREISKRKVTKESETLTCQLERIEKVTLHGKVQSYGTAIPHAEVKLAQWLNDKYLYEASSQTDANGEFTMDAYNDSTELLITADGYIDNKIVRRSLGSSGELGIIEMSEAQGKVVALNLSYQEATREGAEPIVLNWYSDTRNIEYHVHNATKGKDVDDFSLQQGNIVMPKGTDQGDRIRVTLRSLNEKFAEVTAEGIIAENDTANISINLLAYGGIEATFGQRADEQLLVMLYDNGGKLQMRTICSTSRLTFTNLAAGSYTMVTMGYNGAVGSVADISDLASMDLLEGSDYVSTTCFVRDGVVSAVNVSYVPELDASKFEYTGANTYFTVNKTQLVAGNFVTLSTRLDFKEQYAGKIDNARIIVDIPEGCEFVSNSVVSGVKPVPHSLNGNKLTMVVGKENLDSRIRFCVVPTQSGKYLTSALAEFDYKGAKAQPMGQLMFEGTSGELYVPSVTRTKTVALGGIGVPKADVEVYDNDVLIGTTRSLANGKWELDCELDNAYNLSTHNIYVQYRGGGNAVGKTESKECLYNMNAITLKRVTMLNIAHPAGNLTPTQYETIWDFENLDAGKDYYSYWPNYPDFTFLIDFTENDTTKVSDVVLSVYTNDGGKRELPAKYDGKRRCFVSTSSFDSYSAPVNVGVDYRTNTPVLMDSEEIEKIINGNEANSLKAELSSIDNLFNVLEKVDEDSDEEDEIIDQLIETIKNDLGINPIVDSEEVDYSDMSDEELLKSLEQSFATILSFDFSNYDDFDYSDNPETYQIGNYIITSKPAIDYSQEKLEAQGFRKILTVRGDPVYHFHDKSKSTYVDLASNIYISIQSVELPNRSRTFRTANDNSDILWNWESLLLDKNLIDKTIRESENKIKALTTEYNEARKKYKKARDKGKYGDAKKFKEEKKAAKQILDKASKNAKYLKYLKPVAKSVPYLDLGINAWEVNEKLKRIDKILNGIPTGCSDQDAINYSVYLQVDAGLLRDNVWGYYSSNVAATFGAGVLVAAAGAAWPPSLLITVPAVVVGQLNADNWFKTNFDNDISDLESRLKNIKARCGQAPNGDDDDKKRRKHPKNKDIDWDPSGYVYEAVPTNRIEGVKATVFYDEDENVPVQWSAEDYGQINPQITEEDGLYAWDVPQGMWKVVFEKEGYETTETDWLPVPPPQLEVNIPMSQAVAPYVEEAKGAESGVTLAFSKYMIPETLMKSSCVIVTCNGEKTKGDIELLNLEENPYNQEEYASKIKFVPSTAFNTSDEVVVTVKKEVESYAGKQMDEDFVQRVKIQSEITSLNCDSVMTVDYQGTAVLEVSALPAFAAKGKTVYVSSVSPIIADVENQSVTLDDEGKARLIIKGELPGGTSVRLSMPEAEKEKYVMVTVVNKEEGIVKAPKASKLTGSTIEAGYLLWLTCNTPGATIYYTLDGSCPCDAESRIKYTGPFALPAGQVTVSAVAVRQGMEDSDVATYVYTVEGDEQGIADTKADLHIDAEYADGVLTISGAEGCTVRVFDLLGRELVSRRSAGKSVSVQIPKAESYVVSVTTRDGQTVVRKVTGK